MIKIDLENINVNINNIESNKDLCDELSKIKQMKKPAFAEYDLDLAAVKKECKKFEKYKNIILIGNGGSITSFSSFYNALKLKNKSDKKVFILSTMEPDLLNSVKKECGKSNTLVIPISKSGDTVGVMEALMYFIDYPILAVTSENKGTLKQIVDVMKLSYLIHPEVGGRYSGLTPSGIVPSLLYGLDVAKIISGAKKMYELCDTKVPIEKNPALQISSALYLLDNQGYNEIFMPIYSSRLEGFTTLIMQLLHESSGKEGKGQTIYGAFAPESQHHTNQRFFGGKKNVIGMFTRVGFQDNENMDVKVPKKLQQIKIRDGLLKNIDGIPYSKALEFEYIGTRENAKHDKIPHIVIEVDKITEGSVGEFLALWHYIAVYSSILRGVNPFDQPEVEYSKKISFELTKKYKK